MSIGSEWISAINKLTFSFVLVGADRGTVVNLSSVQLMGMNLVKCFIICLISKSDSFGYKNKIIMFIFVLHLL